MGSVVAKVACERECLNVKLSNFEVQIGILINRRVKKFLPLEY